MIAIRSFSGQFSGKPPSAMMRSMLASSIGNLRLIRVRPLSFLSIALSDRPIILAMSAFVSHRRFFQALNSPAVMHATCHRRKEHATVAALPAAHADRHAVLDDDIDTGVGQGALDLGPVGRTQIAAPGLIGPDGLSADAGGVGELCLGAAGERAGGPACRGSEHADSIGGALPDRKFFL